jgi:hypothetical protein
VQLALMGFRSPKAFGGLPIALHLYVGDVDAVVRQAVAAGARELRSNDGVSRCWPNGVSTPRFQPRPKCPNIRPHASSSSNALASLRSAVSKPSMNQS